MLGAAQPPEGPPATDLPAKDPPAKDPPATDAPATPVEQPAAPPVHPDAAILQNPDADAAARSAAAGRLLAAADGKARAAAAALLAADAPSEPARALVERAAELSNAPGWLLEPCRGLVEAPGTSPGLRSAAILAIGSIRSRDAVRVLISLLDDRARPELREPAARALARLTGRSDLGADQRRWRDWFAQIEWLPELEWRTLLAVNLAEAADRAARERDRSTALLLDALRGHFQEATTAQQRSTLLVRFLRHELAAVRRLGVQMTRQELANARPLEPAVGKAVESLLADPSREFRRGGAELLAILPPGDGGEAVAAALIREEDPDVAAPLLRAAGRNPTPELTRVVVRWLEGPEICRQPSLNAAAALHAAGHLMQPEDVRTFRDALRRTPLDELTPGASGTLAMYYALGDEEDRARVQALLASPDSIRRLAAADLLAGDAGAVDAILAAAAQDPELARAATRAVARHRAVIEGYNAIAGLAGPSPAARRDLLLEVAEAMAPRDLLVAARATHDPAFREAILARLTGAEELRTLGVWKTAMQSPYPSVIAGLLLLCRTRLELGQPAGALEVLNDLEPIAQLIDQSEFEGLRTVTLLWLNRIEEAGRGGGSSTDWVDGLERAIGLPHAGAIVRAIDQRFGELNGSEGARLRELRDRLPGG